MKKIFQKTAGIIPPLPVREWVEKRVQFAIAESVAQAHQESKQQLVEVKSEIQDYLQSSIAESIAQAYQNSKQEIAEFNSKIQADLQSSITESVARAHQDNKHQIAELKSEIQADLQSSIAESVARAHQDSKQQIAEFDSKIQASIADLADKSYVERRVKLSILEVQGFFDQNVETVSNSLRAIGKVICELQELTKENSRIVPKIQNEIQELQEKVKSISHFLKSMQMENFGEGHVKLDNACSSTNQPPSAPKIINQAKLDAMKPDGIRLNVGCGHIPLEGYLNVNGRELPGIDIVCDAHSIPFENGSIKEILSVHLVEHFPANVLESVILPHWFTLLETGGTLVTVAPDGGAMLEAVNAGTMSYEDFREVLFGGQEYDNDFHYNMLTVDSFSALLNHVGFSDVKLEYSGKRNGKCFEFRVTARKP